MTAIVCDASVLVKWFVDEPGPDLAPARALLAAVESDRASVCVHELAYLEIGNVLAVKRGWGADRIERVMRVLRVVTGTPEGLDPPALADTVRLSAAHGLTVYDASYWALARRLDASLVTADQALLAAEAGETPASICKRLGFHLAP